MNELNLHLKLAVFLFPSSLKPEMAQRAPLVECTGPARLADCEQISVTEKLKQPVSSTPLHQSVTSENIQPSQFY